jgi:hypothetical protein
MGGVALGVVGCIEQKEDKKEGKEPSSLLLWLEIFCCSGGRREVDVSKLVFEGVGLAKRRRVENEPDARFRWCWWWCWQKAAAVWRDATDLVSVTLSENT